MATLRETLSAEIQRGSGPVIVDLKRVDPVDASTLATLLNARRRLARAGRGLAVICPPGAERRLFAESRLEADLGVCDSMRQARKTVAGPLHRTHPPAA